MKWTLEIAVLLGAAMISASILFIEHWDISATSADPIVAYRLDRWTGTIDYCVLGESSDAMSPAEFYRRMARDGALPVNCLRPKTH